MCEIRDLSEKKCSLIFYLNSRFYNIRGKIAPFGTVVRHSSPSTFQNSCQNIAMYRIAPPPPPPNKNKIIAEFHQNFYLELEINLELEFLWELELP